MGSHFGDVVCKGKLKRVQSDYRVKEAASISTNGEGFAFCLKQLQVREKEKRETGILVNIHAICFSQSG